MSRIPIIFCLLLLPLSTLFSQNTSPCACCADGFRAFDFWLGEWEVFDTTGKKVGENIIRLAQDSCLLIENWKSTSSSHTGTSSNFYNKTNGKWKQVWVDNSGLVLELQGGLVGDQMTLLSDQLLGKQGNPYFHRVRWIPGPEGTVRQIWEVIDLKGAVKKVIFNGKYVRLR